LTCAIEVLELSVEPALSTITIAREPSIRGGSDALWMLIGRARANHGTLVAAHTESSVNNPSDGA
jgi:hypothetical protein